MPKQQDTPYKRPLTSFGKKKVHEMMTKWKTHGVQSKIDYIHDESGSQPSYETVLVFSPKLGMWYEAITPAELTALNVGAIPKNYEKIIQRPIPKSD